MSAASQRVLLHAFSTFKLGGPQARFVQLANAFGARYRHIVVAMDGNFEAGSRLSSDVPWEAMPIPVRRGGALANRGAFRALLQAVRPDLLISYNWGTIEWTAANLPRRVPQVHVEDGFGPEESAGQLPRRVWTRRILLGAGRVPVIVASRNLERLATKVWWVDARRLRFFANGVPSQQPHGTRATNARLTIGTVAGLRQEKNVARLVRAFAALRAYRDAQLVIVGDGPERAAVAALASELGVAADVEFTGYLENPGERLRQFDLFALSSDTEQLPISMLEAMALGIPVVATRVGDVADVLPAAAHGGLCTPDDASFSACLLAAVAGREHWPEWSEAGLNRVRTEFAEDRMLGEWGKVFDGTHALLH